MEISLADRNLYQEEYQNRDKEGIAQYQTNGTVGNDYTKQAYCAFGICCNKHSIKLAYT
jgi:hypothetical protein